MKKRRIPLAVPVLLLLIALSLCGTVLAYMFKTTESKDNEFTPANVACKVVEEFDGTQKTGIQVQNTGNIDAYLRLRLVSYWVDADGSIAAKPSAMPEIAVAAGWLEGANNTYYYKTPVSPGGKTVSLLSSPLVLERDDKGYVQVIEVFAEAIQSDPHRAAADSWGVSIDANGEIVSP